MKLEKGPRGFGFSLVAAPTFYSNVCNALFNLLVEIIMHDYNGLSKSLVLSPIQTGMDLYTCVVSNFS